MTYIDDVEVVYNLQVWFRKNSIDSLPNDDRAWRGEFEAWLREQGCEIERGNDRLLRNSFGMAPGYDRLRFDRDEDAMLFALRWR
jgi:hypothetical protein